MTESCLAQLNLGSINMLVHNSKDSTINMLNKLKNQTEIIRKLYLDLYEINDSTEKVAILFEDQLKCHSCDWKLNELCTNRNCMSNKRPFVYKRLIDDILNEKEAGFRCSLCFKSYKSKENLKLHKANIHMNFKPYKCRLCNKRFSHRNGKLYHEKTFHSKKVLY